jgi:glycosyltransferase involved in cell wall biosynthesis
VRIALVADEDPGWGGIGTYTGVLGSGLAALGHEVKLVLRGWERDGVETLDGLTVHRVTVGEPSWRRGTIALSSRLYTARESIVFSRGVTRALKAIAPDVVEAPEFHAPGLVPAVRSRLGLGGPSVVVRLHAPAFLTGRLAAERPDFDVRAGEALEAASVRCAQLITAPSRAVAELVRRRWRMTEARLRVVPNPIDEQRFAPAPAPAPADAAPSGTILVVGRIERAKGQDLLVEALPAIRQAVPDAALLLVGDDGGAAAELARRAAALGVRDAITFAGARPREELPSIYRSAAVCVVPSRFESFPYSALEAMACGRAVVAARVGGLPEVVEQGRDGVLVAPESPAELGAAVARLLLDPDERRRLGHAARERVLSAFTASRVAAAMVERYAEVSR